MAKTVFDHDPLTGVTELLEFEEGEGGQLKAHVTSIQDVQPLLDRNKAWANTGAKDHGIKSGLWHYASIPLVVQMELLKKGININNRNHHKAMLAEINANYPYLKTTHKKHA